MEIFYFHSVIATFFSYFIVSIAYRDLVWSVILIDWYRYRGTRAVLLSLVLLLFLSFIIVPILKDRYEWFNFATFAYSFIVGLPVAWLLQRLAVRFAGQSRLTIAIPEHLPPNKVTLKRFAFWLIAGLPAGALFGFVLFILSNSFILSIILSLLCAIGISWLLSRTNWM